MGLWDALAAEWRAERPVALVEVIGGPEELIGRKLVVRPASRRGAGQAARPDGVERAARPDGVERAARPDGAERAETVDGAERAETLDGAERAETPGSLGSLGDPGLDRVVTRDALGELSAGRSVSRTYGRHGEISGSEVEVFIESFGPAPSMVIVGAVDFSAALGRVTKVLGYRVTVCDARQTFATRGRFPMADEIVVDWPHRYLKRIGPTLGERDAVCVLTHDPKFDIPALIAALDTRAGYVGAMGSRRTQEERIARLRDAGVGEPALDRIMAPIGLDIGARTPEETAVAICAEIIAIRAGKQAPSLRDGEGPIHQGDL